MTEDLLPPGWDDDVTYPVTLLVGDCRARLRELPAESVHCCVTSPPYYGLRDYGTEPQVWGGDPDCAHEWGEALPERRNRWGSARTLSEKQHSNQGSVETIALPQGCFCQRCGAWRGQLGLEPTPDLFVEHLVEIFREVRRVLAKDGTLWLNLGDSYAGGGCGARDPERWPKQSRNDHMPVHVKRHTGLKNKDLIGVPWMTAFALRADGWYLRSDVIWHKPNPMPESVEDRPSKAHEYVFLLSKSERYYYDLDAIREPYAEATLPQLGAQYSGEGQKAYSENGVQNPSDVKRRVIESMARNGGRNARTVWTIATQPFSASALGVTETDHYAAYPEELPRRCILAGCPEGGVVLDPFGGTGTTGAVAVRYGRRAVLCEVNSSYAEIIRRRCEREAGLFVGPHIIRQLDQPVPEPLPIPGSDREFWATWGRLSGVGWRERLTPAELELRARMAVIVDEKLGVGRRR